MQPSRRLYAESKNVLRLSQPLRSRSFNLRSLARQLPSSFPVQSHSSVSQVGVVPGVASLPAVQSSTSQALPSAGQAFSPPPPGSIGAVQVTRSLRTPAPGELGFTQEQIDATPPLDLGLENLLRQCDVKEPVIQAFRVRGITDRFLFVALDETTEGLRSTCREALGVDTNFNFEHKLEFAKISKAWSSAKIASETKEKIDAVHRARGEPVQMLEGDWVSLIRAFKAKYGKNIHPSRLPAQRYYESYEEKLSNTTWRAEPLTHVVSLQEEEKQKALRQHRDPFGQFPLNSNTAPIYEQCTDYDRRFAHEVQGHG